MYIVDTSDLTLDVWSLMRSSAELLSKGLLWMSTITSIRNPAAPIEHYPGLQVSSGDYLLGLGTCQRSCVIR